MYTPLAIKVMSKKSVKKQRAEKRKSALAVRRQVKKERREWNFLEVLPTEIWVNIFMCINDPSDFFALASTCTFLYNMSRNTAEIADMFATRYRFQNMPIEEKPYLDTFQCAVTGVYHGVFLRTFCYVPSQVIHYNYWIVHGWNIKFKTGEPYRSRLFENGVGKEVRFVLPHDIRINNDNVWFEGPVTAFEHECMTGDPYFTLDPFAANSYIAMKTTLDDSEELLGRLRNILTTPRIVEWGSLMNHVDAFLHHRLVMTLDILRLMGKDPLYVYSFYRGPLVRRIYTFNDCSIVFRYRKNGQLRWITYLSAERVPKSVFDATLCKEQYVINRLSWNKQNELSVIHTSNRHDIILLIHNVILPRLQRMVEVSQLDPRIEYLNAAHLIHVINVLDTV